jgi:hypothetical protein
MIKNTIALVQNVSVAGAAKTCPHPIEADSSHRGELRNYAGVFVDFDLGTSGLRKGLAEMHMNPFTCTVSLHNGILMAVNSINGTRLNQQEESCGLGDERTNLSASQTGRPTHALLLLA